MSWEDGGPLDPPETREVDCWAWLEGAVCADCGEVGQWDPDGDGREVTGPVWRCSACGEGTYAEQDVRDAVAEEHLSAWELKMDRWVDEARDGALGW